MLKVSGCFCSIVKYQACLLK